MTIDVLYLAWNRLAFTQASFPLLLANTNWDVVRRLAVFDDGSVDGTRAYLDQAVRDCPVDAKVVHLGHHSPVTTMNYYLGHDPADAFAKIDSDIAVPPGWLDALAEVFDAHHLDLLGMEAGMTWLPGRDGREWDGVYGFEPCRHIGGVGLMRTAAFADRPMRAYGRFGFTEWQHANDPKRGWIAPDLLVPQLDRIPDEPWAGLSRGYIEKGWQRPWPPMQPEWAAPYYDWLPAPEEVAA